jgi:hypothetical protein
MTTFVKRLILWSVLLAAVALVMSVGQWLTVPEGYGADAWVHALSDRGHTTIASVLRGGRAIANTQIISGVVNSAINAPRDRLLRSFGYLNVENARSFYATPHRMFTDDWRAILMFALGTVVVYFPLAVVLALVRTKNGRSRQTIASPHTV